jgi:hypothetical protein
LLFGSAWLFVILRWGWADDFAAFFFTLFPSVPKGGQIHLHFYREEGLILKSLSRIIWLPGCLAWREGVPWAANLTFYLRLCYVPAIWGWCGESACFFVAAAWLTLALT